MILFLCFYSVERLFSLLIEISILKPPCWEVLLLFILNPLHLEEFFFLLRAKKHDLYIKSGIIGQAIVICVFGVPLSIITIVWVTSYHMTTTNIVLISFVFASLINGISFFPFNYLFSQCTQFVVTKSKQKLNLAYQYLLSMLHFYTYLWMFCLNLQINYFGMILIFGFPFSIACLLLSISKNLRRSQYQIRRKVMCAFFLIILKELFHSVYDVQSIDRILLKFSIKKYGLQVFNNLLVFELLQKILFLVIYSIFVFQEVESSNDLYSFYLVIFILSCLSTFILAKKVFQNMLWNKYISPNYVEFTNYADFQKQSSKINQIATLQGIYLTDKTSSLGSGDLKLIVENLFFLNGRSELEINETHRLDKPDKNEQIIKITYLFDLETINTFISNKRVLPQIKEIQFNLKDRNDIPALNKSFAENNLGVLIKTQFDENQLMLSQQKLYYEVQAVCAQIMVFSKYLSQHQIFQPKQIIYDLQEYDVVL